MLGSVLKTLAVVGLIVSGLGLVAGVTTILSAGAETVEPQERLQAESTAAQGVPESRSDSGRQIVGVSLMAMGGSLVVLVGGIVLARHDRRGLGAAPGKDAQVSRTTK